MEAIHFLKCMTRINRQFEGIKVSMIANNGAKYFSLQEFADSILKEDYKGDFSISQDITKSGCRISVKGFYGMWTLTVNENSPEAKIISINNYKSKIA